MDCCPRAVAVALERCQVSHCQRRRCCRVVAHAVQLVQLVPLQLVPLEPMAQLVEMAPMQLVQPEQKAWQIVESCLALTVPRQLESHQRWALPVLPQPSLPPPS
jgi:hypothetical protein